MLQKKSSNWYIAATHYLTAGFAIPLVIGLIATFLIKVSAPIFISAPILLAIFLLTIKLLSLWLGIRYSANYLEKAYIIDNKDKIVNLSTIYFAVLHFGYFLLQALNISRYGNEKLIGLGLEIIITTVLFYVFSKKYIRNTKDSII